MSTDCIFCKIITGEIPSQKVYEDELVMAFRDIHPVAPIHVLIVPKKHLATVNEIGSEDEPAIGHLFSAARQIANDEHLQQSGYRLIINTGPDAGQVVFHLHMHLIGGNKMRYPMG